MVGKKSVIGSIAMPHQYLQQGFLPVSEAADMGENVVIVTGGKQSQILLCRFRTIINQSCKH